MIFMKKIKEKGFFCLKLVLLGMAVYFCAAETCLVKKAVSDSVERCLTIVIPSLYAMMIAAVMITKSGVLSYMPGFVKNLGRVLFGMGGECLPVFLFGMFAGYPAGTRMITEQYSSGEVSAKSAPLLCGVCFGAGPAFVFGCISGELYSSGLPGKIIIISTAAANIIMAFVISFFLRKYDAGSNDIRKPVRIDGILLTESAASAGRTMGELCFMVTAFSVITAMLSSFGVISAAADFFSRITGFSEEVSGAFIPAVLDITAVRGLPTNNYALLPWLCALVSFGGICVLFQASAIISGRFSVLPFVVIRLAASVLSYCICRIIMPFMISEEIIAAASVNVSAHSAPSFVPSLMLLFMTFIIMAEYDKLVKIQK